MTRETLIDLLKKAAEEGEAQYYETTPPDFADASIKHGMIVDAQLLALESAGVRMVPVEATDEQIIAAERAVQASVNRGESAPIRFASLAISAWLSASPFSPPADTEREGG